MPVPLFDLGAQAMMQRPPVLAPLPPEQTVAVLHTERLTLRAFSDADVKAIARFANDRRVAENTFRIPHPYRVEDAENFLAAANRQPGEATLVIALRDGPVGICSIELREGVAEIGYWLGVPFWGHGYATEAARALIDHAFGELGHDALMAGARVSNPASRRVLEKCGFQWTGVGLYRIRAISSSAPFDRFRLDRGLWASLKTWGRAKEVA
jgi:RimJ/RimL family protein N-acetyltransferase